MIKSELMENYTMEQLADMVVEKYDKVRSEERPYGAHYDLGNGKAVRFIGFEKDESQPFFQFIDDRINGEPINLYPSDKLLNEVDEIKELKSQLDRKQTEINQIDDILNELFGVRHDVASKPEYFKEILRNRLDGETSGKSFSEKENMTKNMYGMYKLSSGKMTKDDVLLFLGVLTKELIDNGIDFKYDMEEMKIYDMVVKTHKIISDILPTEPIKVADMLINAEGEYERIGITKAIYGEGKETYNLFGISELRQIAQHLLVYCNANESEEEEC